MRRPDAGTNCAWLGARRLDGSRLRQQLRRKRPDVPGWLAAEAAVRVEPGMCGRPMSRSMASFSGRVSAVSKAVSPPLRAQFPRHGTGRRGRDGTASSIDSFASSLYHGTPPQPRPRRAGCSDRASWVRPCERRWIAKARGVAVAPASAISGTRGGERARVRGREQDAMAMRWQRTSHQINEPRSQTRRHSRRPPRIKPPLTPYHSVPVTPLVLPTLHTLRLASRACVERLAGPFGLLPIPVPPPAPPPVSQIPAHAPFCSFRTISQC
jgi:hypothetical protein